MLQITNTTPFATDIAIFPDENAIDTLYVMVKGTFNIGDRLAVAEEQKALIQGDQYYSEPGHSSLKYPSDYHPGKPTTDIIMLGSACAVDKHPVRQLDVQLSVGFIKKTVRVFGERRWQNGQISRPDTFETIRMRYENAFGGQDLIDGAYRSSDLRNPVGKGFKGKRDGHQMEGTALPNLEDPSNLIQNQSDQPQPFCFAAIAPNWSARASLAGTYDSDWEANRAPYLPNDYNPAFMNCASYGLVYPDYLVGGESVFISGMHPNGELHFELPFIQLHGTVDKANTKEILNFQMETLTLEPNELSLSMTWRAKLNCGKHISKIKDICVGVNS